MSDPLRLAGIDVGGPVKGFHVAVVDTAGALQEPVWRAADPMDVAIDLQERDVVAVGIDAPRSPAPDGDRSRQSERDLRRALRHGIFWTPDRAAIAGHYLEGWMRNGFALFAALSEVGIRTDEVFPSASYRAWAPTSREPGERKALWTSRVIASRAALLGEHAASLSSQDHRDAVAAAWTMADDAAGNADRFGPPGADILVARPCVLHEGSRTTAARA